MIGVLVDWLLKQKLPDKPRLPHVLAGITTIIVFGIFAVFPPFSRNQEDPIDTLESSTYFPFHIGSSMTYNYGKITESTDYGNSDLHQKIGSYKEIVINAETGIGDKIRIIKVK